MELEYFDQIIFDYFDRNIFDKEWTKSGKQFKHVLISLLCFALPVCILPSLDVIRVDSSFFHILFRSLVPVEILSSEVSFGALNGNNCRVHYFFCSSTFYCGLDREREID